MTNNINICGINHKIEEYTDIFDCDTHFGQIDYATATIKINKDLPDDLKQLTLVHEILHGILTLTGYDDLSQDETLIKTLSCELNRIFDIKGNNKIAEHDGCVGCKYVNVKNSDYPCINCKQNYKDKYEGIKVIKEYENI